MVGCGCGKLSNDFWIHAFVETIAEILDADQLAFGREEQWAKRRETGFLYCIHVDRGQRRTYDPRPHIRGLSFSPGGKDSDRHLPLRSSALINF